MTVTPVEPGLGAVEWLAAHDEATVRQHLSKGLTELARERDAANLYWAYYDGDQLPTWLTDKDRDALGRQFKTDLDSNFCGLAVDAPLTRLQVTSWEATAAGDDADVAAAQMAWEDNDLDLDQEELFRHAMVAGKSFVVVWPRTDEDGQQLTEDGRPVYDVSWNDARDVHVEYGSLRRRDRAWALKLFVDGKRWRANLYYPDEIVRLVTPERPLQKGQPAFPSAKLFSLDRDDPGGPHDFGKVPVIRFAQDRRGRSRLARLISIQEKINTLEICGMVAARFSAHRQMAAMTDQPLPDGFFKATPGAVWQMSPVGNDDNPQSPIPAQLKQYDYTPLENYDDSVDKRIKQFFTIASLPRHMQVNPGVAPSGEAIEADETPFDALVQDHQQMYGGALVDVMDLLGLRVKPVWADVDARSQTSKATEFKTLRDGGMPLRSAAARALRLGTDELDELDKQANAAATAEAARRTSVGSMALQAFDQGRPLGSLVADE